MTKKDYKLIAEAIMQSRQRNEGLDSPYDHQESRQAAIDETSEVLARKLGFENSRFDRNKFLRACGHADYQPKE